MNFTCCHQTAMSDVINPRLQLNRNVERYFLQVFKRLRRQCDVTDIFHVDQCTLNKSTLQAHFVYVRSVQNRHPHQSDQPRGIGLTRTLPPVHACGAKRAGAGSAHPAVQEPGLKGGLSLGVGVAGLSLFKGPLKDAMAYQNQLSNLNVLGMKQAEIAEVVGKAWQVSRDVVTSTATDNLKAYRELRSAFGAGHEHEALSVLPQVQMASSILEAVSGQK